VGHRARGGFDALGHPIALRALAYVGTTEDLPLIEDAARIGAIAAITNQAAQTAKAIRMRTQSAGQ